MENSKRPEVELLEEIQKTVEKYTNKIDTLQQRWKAVDDQLVEELTKNKPNYVRVENLTKTKDGLQAQIAELNQEN